MRRRFLLSVLLFALVAALPAGAAAPPSQDGWIDELALDNALQRKGVSHGPTDVNVLSASCTGLSRYGVRVKELLIEFNRFRCALDGDDHHTYTATVLITKRTSARFYWQVTSLKRSNAVPTVGGAATLTGKDATSGGSWISPVTGYRFSCPAAPAGFRNARGNPAVNGSTPDGPSPNGPNAHIRLGADEMAINCIYLAKSGRRITILADFALPNVNDNPYNDFDIGCGQNMHYPGAPSEYRSYFVASPTRWAYATFTDYDRVVKQTELPRFQLVTRTLLYNVQGAASTCSLDTTVPLEVAAIWDFFFSDQISGKHLTASLTARGGFTTHGAPDSHDQITVGYLYTAPLVTRVNVTDFSVKPRGVKYKLGLAFGAPRYHFGLARVGLTLKVTVKTSNYPACPAGSTGTMTFSISGSAPQRTTGKLSLCGLFDHAEQNVDAQIRRPP